MIVHYRYVGPEHSICRGVLPARAKDFFEVLPVLARPRAVIATSNRIVIGFLRFTTTYNNRRLYAAGTWVHPVCQKHGIATEMWRRMLNHVEPSLVEVRTISTGGRRLVGKMIAEADCDIVWKVTV